MTNEIANNSSSNLSIISASSYGPEIMRIILYYLPLIDTVSSTWVLDEFTDFAALANVTFSYTFGGMIVLSILPLSVGLYLRKRKTRLIQIE